MERIGTKIVIVLSLFMGLALAVGSFFITYVIALIPVAAYGMRMLFWRIENIQKKSETEDANEKA